MSLHPSPTARQGHIPTNAVRTGISSDVTPFSAFKEVWCKQCGFRCNLDRDSRNVDQFAGETTTSGNVFNNGSFEDWTAGSPDSWTVSGSVTQNSTSGYYDPIDDGVSSCQITRSGSDISLSQSVATPSNFNSNIVNIGVRVKCGTNGVIRLRVDVNSTSHYSSYNVAQQRFQDVSLLINCPETVSSLTAYILADNANGTAYVDRASLIRSGSPTTASVTFGCPMCGSSNYF